MSKFIEDSELTQVDLGDDEWIKIPTQVSFEMAGNMGMDNDKLSLSQKTINMFLCLIKEWNLKDSKGNLMPINSESIGKLNLPTIDLINQAIMPLLTVKKNESLQ